MREALRPSLELIEQRLYVRMERGISGQLQCVFQIGDRLLDVSSFLVREPTTIIEEGYA